MPQKVNYERELENLKTDEESDFRFQERRHQQWKDNYHLFRDTVQVNRLTQRQSVNIPLMKVSIKTNLAGLDQFNQVEFEELGNNKDKEILFNAYWQDTVTRDRMELKDVVDKKQEQLYGITWTKLNIRNGRFETEIREPWDILKDRYADPTDYDNTAHHLIEGNIFRTFDQLEGNPNYNRDAIKRLKVFYASKQGLLRAEEVARMMQAKNERLGEMGVPDIDNPQLGHTVVELKAYFVKVWDDKDQEEHIHLIVRADTEILMAKPLKEILGINFFPFVGWSSDPERNEQYPDGTADSIRTLNQVLNVWFSQLTENRTMRNMNMNFYDATANPEWVPQMFEAIPFGWYPLPGKPGEVYQNVEIQELSESIDEMNFLMKLGESVSGATPTTKGETEQQKVTLGEVELALGQAKERISATNKFSMLAQKEKAEKFAKLVNANPEKLEAVKLYKKSFKGNMVEKVANPNEWRSEKGYNCRVVSTAEKEAKTVESLQKMNAARQFFPGNMAFDRITKEKVLDFIGLNPEQTKEVMEVDTGLQNQGMIMGQMNPSAPVPAINQPQPI